MGLKNFGSTITGLAGLASGLTGGKGSKGGDSFYNINKFQESIDEHGGLYKPTLFYVEIHPMYPNKWWGGPGSAIDLEPFRFLCNSASLPGIQLLASDHRRQNFGSMDRRPYNVQTTDIPLTFFIDNGGRVANFFNMWTRNIINYDSSLGELSATADNDAHLFEIAYRDKYLCQVVITCLSGAGFGDEPAATKENNSQFNVNSGYKIMQYTLNEAWPLQVGDVTVAWSETDTFSSLPVQFTFRNYKTLMKQQLQAVGSRAFSLSETLGLISGGIGVVQGLTSGGGSNQSIIMNAVNMLAGKKIQSSRPQTVR
jgi:hypothetical protein